MRNHFFLFCLLFVLAFSGCAPPSENTRPTNFDQALLIGGWRLDSVADGMNTYNQLFILEDGRVYEFYRSAGGSCRMFQLIAADTILTEFGEKLITEMPDSNTIKIKGEYSRWEHYYKRDGGTDRLHYHLQADSLRSRIIGWWRVTKSSEPIKMFNHGRYCNRFTVNIRDDGEAEFYLENNLDSMLHYDYIAAPDGISLQHGCVVGMNEIVTVDSSRMKMIWGGPYRGDTLVLERVHMLH
jgi:hypothetical protein